MAPGTEGEVERGFCHSCARAVEARVNSETGELECVRCQGSFVELVSSERSDDDAGLSDFLTANRSTAELETPSQTTRQRSASVGTAPSSSAAASAANRSGNPDQSQHAGVARARFGVAATGRTPVSTSDLVATAIRQIISQAQQGEGATRQSVATRGEGLELLGAIQPLLAAGRGEALLGDYAVGSLSNIIEQLVANDPTGGRAPTPASERAVGRLCKTVEIEQCHVDDGWECGIFKEPFGIGEKATTLPCGHVFLDHAIARWFKDHHSCPVCRHALPTEADEAAAPATST